MNSKVLPFLIIAGLVLAGAAVWNLTTDDAEKPVSSTEQNIETPVVDHVTVQQPNTETQPSVEDIVIEDFDKTELSPPIMTEEAIKKRKEKASSLMSFAMRYKTADKTIDALRLAKKNGDEKLAADLLDYIRLSFPNTSIPSELLD